MLEEIGQRPGTVTGPTGSGNNNSDAAQVQTAATVATDREGYALAAGLALGLICLGRGHQAQGLADLGIEARLRCAFQGALKFSMCQRLVGVGNKRG